MMVLIGYTVYKINIFFSTENHTVNSCFSVAGVPTLVFNKCSTNEFIQVTVAIQGISRVLGQCVYQEGDCAEPVSAETEQKLHKDCIGRTSCEIPVSVTWMTRCSTYSSYNYVLYQCIPGTCLNCSERYRRIESIDGTFQPIAFLQ